ncbi:MAG: DUF3313 family protein [Xanthomonadales bacterium]|nr:DUF3313 family protein [Xanthomonadales bacterium]NNK34342.1 DUF3313 family protein [Xanthomonadales bacterium]
MQHSLKRYVSLWAVTLMAFAGISTAQAEDALELFENLVPVDDSKVAMAYIDPNADFTVFKRVKILDTFVAFRSGWERDQRRGTRSVRISANDMERIKRDVAVLFKDVFTEALEADDGFEVVDEAGDDVLLLRPAIIDLDITAPDVMGAGRSTSFTSTAGSATIYLELYDSVSGQILGRAADRTTIRNATGTISWSNRVTNTQDARRMFRGWATLLREFLDSHYM